MRELNWVEFCEESEKNSNELRNIIKKLRKSPGQSVPDNFVHMAEKDLKEKGNHEIGNVILKQDTEKVLVHDTRDLDEIEDENAFESIENKGDHYEVTFISELDKVIITGSGPLYEVYTPTEAAFLWGLNESTVRKAIQNGKFKYGHDYRKAGVITFITKDALINMYGEPKK